METIQEFESIINLAELRVLSNKSLENPLSDVEYDRMMELKEKVFGGK